MNLLLLLAGGLTAGPTPVPATVQPTWTAPAPLAAAPVAPVEWTGGRPGGNYLTLGGGFVTTRSSDGPGEEIDFDEGYLLSVALGHRFASEGALAFDLELEGFWTDQDADDSGLLQAVNDVTGIGALVNGILDFRLSQRFSVYGGGGLGISWLDVGTESDSLNDFDEEDGPFLTWQAKAGVAFAVSEATELRLGYRFLNVDDAEIDDDIGNADFDLETQQHVLELGLRFGLTRG